MTRSPMFLITDDEYNALGAVYIDRLGRWVGHDTAGRELFNRKDMKGAEQATKRHGLFVSSAWYGVSQYGDTAPAAMRDQMQRRAAEPAARATLTRTRMAIGSQIREALETLGLPVDMPTGTTYTINGQEMGPGEAADYLLVGGFKEAFGGNKTLIQPDRLAERDARQADEAAQAEPAAPTRAPITDRSSFEEALTPGSVWHLTSNPARDTDGPHTIMSHYGRAFTWTREGKSNPGQTYFPGDPSEYRAEGDSLTYLSTDGRAYMTWTRYVRADAVRVGDYVRAHGTDQYGQPITLTGYVGGVGGYVVRKRSAQHGLIGKRMTGLYVTENPGGWNGWRGSVYSEPFETTAVILPAPDAEAAPAPEAEKEDAPVDVWKLLGSAARAAGWPGTRALQEARWARMLTATRTVYGLTADADNPAIIAAGKADPRDSDTLARLKLAEYGRLLADVDPADVLPVEALALPFAEAEAAAQPAAFASWGDAAQAHNVTA